LPKRSRCGSAWQVSQVVKPAILYDVFVVWHEAHVTVACAPASGNDVRLWSNRVRLSANLIEVVWHVEQLGPKEPLCASVWHDEQEGLAVRNERVL
jgi:hypothetical protein